VHWAHLLAVAVAYYDPTPPLLLAKAWVWLLLGMVLCFDGLCAVDARRMFDPPGRPPQHGVRTCWVLGLLAAGNLALTVMACHDALVA